MYTRIRLNIIMNIFAVTPEEDALTCAWYNDILASSNRIVRVSISHFITKENELRVEQMTSWVYFKLFRYSKLENKIIKYQQVCLRPIEAERVLQESGHILNLVMSNMYVKEDKSDKQLERTLSLKENFRITPDDDAELTPLFVDLISSKRRLIRVSHKKYNCDDPAGSSYLQIKHFAKKAVEDKFTRNGQLSMTLQEFRTLAALSDQMLQEFHLTLMKNY